MKVAALLESGSTANIKTVALALQDELPDLLGIVTDVELNPIPVDKTW